VRIGDRNSNREGATKRVRAREIVREKVCVWKRESVCVRERYRERERARERMCVYARECVMLRTVMFWFSRTASGGSDSA